MGTRICSVKLKIQHFRNNLLQLTQFYSHLSGEIAAGWGETDVSGNKEVREKIIQLSKQIVPYNMAHNAEAEACDLLMEIERLDLLEQYVDENIYQRVCLYLTSCVPYVPDPENVTLLQTALILLNKFKQYPQSLRLAMQLNDHSLTEEIFTSCTDTAVQKQLAFMLGRQQIYIEIPDTTPEYEDLIEIMANCHLNNHFLNLAREVSQ